MSENHNIDVSVHVRRSGEDVLKALTRELDAFERRLRSIGSRAANLSGLGIDQSAARKLRDQFNLTSRLSRQRKQEEREAEGARRREDRDVASRLRMQMDFSARMARQRRDEETAARRDELRHERQVASIRRSATGRARGALSSGRDAVDRVTRGTTLAAAVSGAAVAAAVRSGLRARMEADAAEVRAMTFGDLESSEVKRLRSTWGDRSAIRFGLKPGDVLDSYTETIKAGIPREFSSKVAESIMGAVAGLDLDMVDTTKLVGRLSTLTQDPKNFNVGAIGGMLNSVAVVARSTAADSKEIVSALRRGAGVLGASKMSVGDLSAFTAAGISAGMQEGKSGTFLDYLVSEFVNAKNVRGRRGDDLSAAFNAMHLGSRRSVSANTAADPTSMLVKSLESMARMPETMRAKVAHQIGGREWSGELLMLVKSLPILKQALADVADPKNAMFLDKAMKAKLTSMRGLSASLKAVSLLAWESFGAGFEGLYREAVEFFTGKGAGFKFDSIRLHVRAFLDGLRRGFDLTSWTEGFEKIFAGAMRKGGWKSELFKFGQGLSEGILAIVESIQSAKRLLGGGDLDARTLGRWTAEFVGLSIALRIASPVVGVLGAVGSMMTGLATGLIALRGIVGGAGAAAWIRAGLSGLPAALGLGLAAAIGQSRGELATGLLTWIKAGIADLITQLKALTWKDIVGELVDPRAVDLIERFRGNGKPAEPKGDTTPPDPRKDGFQPWLRKGSFGGDLTRGVRDLGDSVRGLNGLVQRASLTSGANLSHSFSGGSAGGQVAGSVTGPRPGFSPGAGSIYGAKPGQALPGYGGSRSWRNNNPGNLKFGPVAKELGATGADTQGFAIFPDYATGRKAQESLLFNDPRYKNLTIGQAIEKWAPGSENDTAGYKRFMQQRGFDPNALLSSLTPEQRSRFLDAQQEKEGWKAGIGSRMIPGSDNAGGAIKGFANLMHGQYGAPGSNLTTITTPSGKKVTVHAAAAESFKGFLGDLEKSGYRIDSLGGYANRGQANRSGRISQHAFGNAIDINPSRNPYKTSITDMPKNVSEMAAKWGLSWGGDWSARSRDPMHFEWAGAQPWLGKKGPTATAENAPTKMPFGLTGSALAELDKRRAAAVNAVPGVVAASPWIAGAGGNTDAIAGAFKSSGWKPAENATAIGLTKTPLPPRRPTAAELASGVVNSGGSRRGGGSVTNHNGAVTNSFTVSGAGDPETVARKVQQHVQESMYRRTHDVDFTTV